MKEKARAGEINVALTAEVLMEKERSGWIGEMVKIHNSQALLVD